MVVVERGNLGYPVFRIQLVVQVLGNQNNIYKAPDILYLCHHGQETVVIDQRSQKLRLIKIIRHFDRPLHGRAVEASFEFGKYCLSLLGLKRLIVFFKM